MGELKEIFRKVLFENYANFNGRASRKEFWLFYFMQYLYLMCGLFVIYLIMLVFLISGIVKGGGTMNEPWIPLIMLLVIYGGIFVLYLPILLPVIAVTARRLHDTGRSAWWMLLGFVPIGGIVVFFFLIQAGNKGRNQYGEDPLEDEYREYFKIIYPHLNQEE